MGTLFAFLTLGIFAWAVIGIIIPRIVGLSGRGQAVGLLGLSMVMFLIIGAMQPPTETELADRTERETAREAERATEKAAREEERIAREAAEAEETRIELERLALMADAPCDLSGNIPRELFDLLCQMAASAHGEGAPLNALTVVMAPEHADLAREIRAGSIEAENMLLELHGAWTRTLGARACMVEVFYGRAHLATAMTNVFSPPSVTFH